MALRALRKREIDFQCKNCGKLDKGYFGQKFCHQRACFITKWKKEEIRECIVCKKNYGAKAQNQNICSKDCRRFFYKSTSPWKEVRLSACTVGAMHEIKVSYELLSKGYEVFRALSPSCSCDLLILKDGKPLRVEVRTGHYTMNGKLYYPENKFIGTKYELMAVVTHKEIVYIPDGVIL